MYSHKCYILVIKKCYSNNSLYNRLIFLLIAQIYCLETIYGREGENLTLVCPVSLPVNSTKTRWDGPPSFFIYSIDGVINPKINRRDRLSVIMNAATGIYNLVIMNLNRLEDEGTYSCSVSLTIKFVKVAFYGINTTLCNMNLIIIWLINF